MWQDKDASNVIIFWLGEFGAAVSTLVSIMTQVTYISWSYSVPGDGPVSHLTCVPQCEIFQDFTWNITGNEIFNFFIIDNLFHLSMQCRETVNEKLSYLGKQIDVLISLMLKRMMQ